MARFDKITGLSISLIIQVQHSTLAIFCLITHEFLLGFNSKQPEIANYSWVHVMINDLELLNLSSVRVSSRLEFAS